MSIREQALDVMRKQQAERYRRWQAERKRATNPTASRV